MDTFIDDEHDSKFILSARRDELSARALVALAKGPAMVLHVRGFVDATTCALLAQRAEYLGYSPYLNVPNVRCTGMAFYETEGKPELIDDCPFGRKMFVGMSCNLRADMPFLAQHDLFARLVHCDPQATDVLMHLAASVYVNVPQHGGELMMWRDEITDAEFLRRRGDKYGMDIEPLGEPDIVVKPQMGDLILFNARKLHAVAPGAGSDRLTLSCFLGFRGDSRPLTFWS